MSLSRRKVGRRSLRTASSTWRQRIESHDAFSHDSIDSLAYDWERIGNPNVEPKYPFKVYLPHTTEDVVRAVKEAKELGHELRIRSKGHSSNDLVLADGGSVLLTQGMTDIREIDAENLTARVQAGTISAVLDDKLAEMGLGLPVIGDHKDITVGGFASVGGISPASHRFGMFVDNVLEMEYVDWDGEVHRCSRERDPDSFYRMLTGLGRYGVMTELKVRLIRIDKYRTVWWNDQQHFRDKEEFIAGTHPIILEPGDVMMERGVWLDFKKGKAHLQVGQFSAYKETTQTPYKKLRNALSYGVLHSIGLLAGNLPPTVDKILKFIGIGGVMFSPRYASIKNVEFFTDKLLDSTVGDPTRMLITLGPLDRYPVLFRDLWGVLERHREETGCFTFISVYVKSIKSEYLARDGQDRFCELMFYVGTDPDKLTPELLDRIVSDYDDVCVANNAYKYMHTKTVRDPERRDQLDPNARHAARRAAASNGAPTTAQAEALPSS